MVRQRCLLLISFRNLIVLSRESILISISPGRICVTGKPLLTHFASLNCSRFSIQMKLQFSCQLNFRAYLSSDFYFASFFKIFLLKYLSFGALVWRVEARFDDMLQKVFFELEGFLNGVLFDSFGCVACGEPVGAYVLGMKQHMGYDSCAHCVIKSFHENNRLLFKVSNHSSFEKKTRFKLLVSLLKKDKLLSTM